MDHNIAIENHTAERYLMGELTEVERDAYEEHFFSCPACADEIRSANAFMESARKVVQDEVRKTQVPKSDLRLPIWSQWLNWRSLLQPMPAAAFALLLAVVGLAGYQNTVTIPKLSQMTKAPVVVAQSQHVALTQSRGESPSVHAGKAFTLTFTIPKPDDPSAGFSSYKAEIVSNDSMIKFSRDISSRMASAPIDMSFPAGALTSGKYLLVIRGVSSSGSDVQNSGKGDLGHLPFEVKNED